MNTDDTVGKGDWDWVRPCPLAGGWCYSPSGCGVMLETANLRAGQEWREKRARACVYRKLARRAGDCILEFDCANYEQMPLNMEMDYYQEAAK